MRHFYDLPQDEPDPSMPSLPPQDGIPAPPCAGIRAGASTVLFEDNDGCSAMGNAQKPTPQTRHIDIKYFSLVKWIECDLMMLERINTSINMSDHMTKGLQTISFHRHTDFLFRPCPTNILAKL